MLHASNRRETLCKGSVFTEYSCIASSVLRAWASWWRGQEAAKWSAAGRDRKPGVKDILRAEITPRCWEHEQAVRVSFTHHGSSQCVLSDQTQTTSAQSSFLVLTIEAANAVCAGLPGTRTSGGRRHLTRGGRLVAVRPVSGRPNSPCNISDRQIWRRDAAKRLI